jgi:hypothetical protein
MFERPLTKKALTLLCLILLSGFTTVYAAYTIFSNHTTVVVGLPVTITSSSSPHTAVLGDTITLTAMLSQPRADIHVDFYMTSFNVTNDPIVGSSTTNTTGGCSIQLLLTDTLLGITEAGLQYPQDVDFYAEALIP